MHRILVQVWTELDPALNVRIDRQSGRPFAEECDVLWRTSRLGRAGVSAAMRASPSEVTAFAVGMGQHAALRHALAAGVDEAVELTVPRLGEPTPARRDASEEDENPVCADADGEQAPRAAGLVAALAAWIRARRPDLVVADRQAGLLAGHLGWAHLAGIDSLELADGHLLAVRHLGRGDREQVAARLPAVVRLHDQSPRPPYVSRARLRSVPVDALRSEPLPAEKLGATEQLGRLRPARNRTRLGSTRASNSNRGLDRLSALMNNPADANDRQPTAAGDSTPEQLAEEFVRYLIHHQLLPPDRTV